uniref:AsnC family transcriptional regulator n=1 Tax=uncultured bacterium W4-39b TaxID=1130994 RepID=H9BWQ9_9BACT|nr:AsnC family transcriptional regulator [uncultured bacterium W4-39b]
MKLSRVAEFDATDRAILEMLQDNCKQPMAAIGQQVGLSAPSVLERIHKLEETGVITGYAAQVDPRRLGKDVTAFIGVATDVPRAIGTLERGIAGINDVLECHHVTGAHTFMLKVKVENTQSLESLIDRLRGFEGVSRTETLVVLSTATERSRIALDTSDEFVARPPRRSGGRARGGRGR